MVLTVQHKQVFLFLKKRCDMAFIEPMHRNKPNITYFFHKTGFEQPARSQCQEIIKKIEIFGESDQPLFCWIFFEKKNNVKLECIIG